MIEGIEAFSDELELTTSKICRCLFNWCTQVVVNRMAEIERELLHY